MGVKFSGVIKHSRAHYSKDLVYGTATEVQYHENYKWQVGDISIWDKDDGIAWWQGEGRIALWGRSKELYLFKEYLGIGDYTPENAERLRLALNSWHYDLDDFTMEKWFDDKNQPKISVAKKDKQLLASISTFGIF